MRSRQVKSEGGLIIQMVREEGEISNYMIIVLNKKNEKVIKLGENAIKSNVADRGALSCFRRSASFQSGTLKKVCLELIFWIQRGSIVESDFGGIRLQLNQAPVELQSSTSQTTPDSIVANGVRNKY